MNLNPETIAAMPNDQPETLADICARIRTIDESMMRDLDFMAVFLKFLPRDIEAAAKRERAIADAMRDALVEILDRTNREKARDYDAALNGGILEIHDIANTALNQERSADALEKARAPGNTAKMREAILAIKEINDRRPHDADGYEINDIIEEALAGNAETKKEAADVCE